MGNKITTWCKENKTFLMGLGCIAGGMTMGYLARMLVSKDTSFTGNVNWVGFDLGEDTTVNIYDVYSSDSMDIQVGHMVVDADYNIETQGFQVLPTFDPASSGSTFYVVGK